MSDQPDPDQFDERPRLRALDPRTGASATGPTPSQTVYLANRLLVTSRAGDEAGLRPDGLARALDDLGLAYRLTARSQRRIDRLRASRGVQAETGVQAEAHVVRHLLPVL